MASLSFLDVKKSFAGVTVLDDFSLEVGEGELVTLLGPSGCGKSTALRLLAGFLEPDAGRIAIDGIDVRSVPPHRRDLGIVFQDYALFPDRSVFANVAYGLRARGLSGGEMRQRVAAILRRVGLESLADRRPAHISGGQRQRVALARALVVDPRALLLDEPLSALDAAVRAAMRAFLKEIQQSFGKTTLLVTHDQEEALSLSDRIAVMTGGRIIEVGTPREIFERPRTATVARLVGSNTLVPVEAVTVAGDACFARVAGGTLAAEMAAPGRSSLLLCLRSDHLDLGPPDAGGPVGRVVQSHYLGRCLEAVIRLESGQDVHVSAGEDDPFLRIGDAVGLRLRHPGRLLDATT